MHREKSFYRIKVKGRLTADWSEWFNHLELSHAPNGDTVLSRPLADQAELFGVLLRIRDLALPLELVSHIQTRSKRVRKKGGHRDKKAGSPAN